MKANAPTILVTGGAGFIGSHTVVELVNAGYRPVIVDNFSNSEERSLAGIEAILGAPVVCHRVDCTDAKALSEVIEAEAPVAGIIHFAAYKAVGESVREPLPYYQNNVGSTVAVVQNMLKHNIKHLVFSSSCTVYGQPDELPVNEQAPIQPPHSPYASTKQICEQVLVDASKAHSELKITSLRYFNPIGAHASGKIGELPLGVPNNLVPYIVQTAAGKRDVLTVFGNDYNTPDGTAVRDYIHVVDLANAHVKALHWLSEKATSGSNTFFNLGAGKGYSVLETIAAFEQASGETLNWKIGPRRPGDIEQIWADSTLANSTLNWECTRDITTAMRDAWNWQKTLDAK